MKRLLILLFTSIFLIQGVLIYAEELSQTTFKLGEVIILTPVIIGPGYKGVNLL